eukprot:TRINITY_DN22416_c0_g1_i1.p1 TRINITY_DN22416_c0_g1~~TRINITY_DN22416_c0_g1_i1.p1  ORF type:complete len:454 (+),score=50.95 TRINITY_DN22416_c0_g1_i1:96-1457(+)
MVSVGFAGAECDFATPLSHVSSGDFDGQTSRILPPLVATSVVGSGTAGQYREKLTSKERSRIDQLLDRQFRKLPPALPDSKGFSPPRSAAMELKATRLRRKSMGAGLAVTYADYRHFSSEKLVQNSRCNPFSLPVPQRDMPCPPVRLPPVNVVMRQFHNDRRVERRRQQEHLRRTETPPARPMVHDYLQTCLAPGDPSRDSQPLELEVKYSVAELTSHYYWAENKKHKKPPKFYSYALAVYFCKRELVRLRRRQIHTLFSLLSRENYSVAEKGIPWCKAKKLHEGFKALDTQQMDVVTMKSFTQAATSVNFAIAPTFFRRLDKDRSGDISFGELLRAAFPSASVRAMNHILNDVGRVQKSRYGIIWEERFSPGFLRDTANLFRHFTKNGETRLHFKRFQQCAPGDLTEEELAAQFAEADRDQDGRLDFVEFATWIQATGADDALGSGPMLQTD